MSSSSSFLFVFFSVDGVFLFGVAANGSKFDKEPLGFEMLREESVVSKSSSSLMKSDPWNKPNK